MLMCSHAQASLNLMGWDSDYGNLCLMLKISYAGCLGLPSAILSQLSLKVCAAAKKCKKNRQKPFFWGFKVIQGHRC